MDYLFCGVVEMRGVHDQQGIACGRSASTLCYDCGTSLCAAHVTRCQLCGQTFCESCLSFHQSEHNKPAQSDQALKSAEKKTA